MMHDDQLSIEEAEIITGVKIQDVSDTRSAFERAIDEQKYWFYHPESESYWFGTYADDPYGEHDMICEYHEGDTDKVARRHRIQEAYHFKK